LFALSFLFCPFALSTFVFFSTLIFSFDTAALFFSIASSSISIAISPLPLIGQMVQEAFEEQTELGWGQALRGRLSMKWRTAMVMYYQEVDEHRREAVPMGEKWMVNTIKALWEHSCSLWTS
jgi:hypothetical protein